MSHPDPFQDLVDALHRTLTSTSTPASPAPPATTFAFTAASRPLVATASPMAKPAPFCGSAEDCNGFILQCSLVLEMQPHLYPDDHSKVAFIISQLDGKALRWAEPLWTSKNPVVLSLSSFISHLKEVFENQHGIQRSGLDPLVRLHLAAYEDSIGLEKFIQLSIRFATRMQLCLEEHQGQPVFPSILCQPESVSHPEPANEPMQIENSHLSSVERQMRLTQNLSSIVPVLGITSLNATFVQFDPCPEENPEDPEPIFPEKLFVNPISWSAEMLPEPSASTDTPPGCPQGLQYMQRTWRTPLIHSTHTSLGTGHPGVFSTTAATLTAYAPKRKKTVYILSSMHSVIQTDNTTKRKPNTVTLYNTTKCGVDVMDQMVREYTVRTGTRRWPVAVFYNMIDMAALNAHVLYQACIGRQERRVDFLVELARELANSHMCAKKARKEQLLRTQPSTPSPGKRAMCQVKHQCKNNHATVRCARCYRYTCGKCRREIPWQCQDSFSLTVDTGNALLEDDSATELKQEIEGVNPKLLAAHKDDAGFIDVQPYVAKLITDKPVYQKQYPLSKEKVEEKPTHPFIPGQQVLIKCLKPTKLGEPKYLGPATVIAVTRTGVLTDFQPQWIHASRLKAAPSQGNVLVNEEVEASEPRKDPKEDMLLLRGELELSKIGFGCVDIESTLLFQKIGVEDVL
ncbi:Retrotransposon-like protein 1 [Anabarilius grahami]|uniref:Retrotransposon-like protein 1 n=1 Tax=Anabarilius grahami TaxID=495550 RepID=A0A3N0YG51_ANAGA|nr:Retrotransposon-like protein 1 [Anabarilius grahami]